MYGCSCAVQCYIHRSKGLRPTTRTPAAHGQVAVANGMLRFRDSYPFWVSTRLRDGNMARVYKNCHPSRLQTCREAHGKTDRDERDRKLQTCRSPAMCSRMRHNRRGHLSREDISSCAHDVRNGRRRPHTRAMHPNRRRRTAATRRVDHATAVGSIPLVHRMDIGARSVQELVRINTACGSRLKPRGCTGDSRSAGACAEGCHV